MKKKKSLRTGFTTGTAAAAAAKGALQYLLSQKISDIIRIPFLSTGSVDISIHSCTLENADTAVCTVIKDAGDDPDITHKAEIGARVSLLSKQNSQEIKITGGEGVGIVTRPGLEILPGEPAINTGPKKMICQAIKDCFDDYNQTGSVQVEIFIPKGKTLALKTMNARLGILGGLSVLGTTGIVRPLSHDAYVATIDASLSVAKASGFKHIYLTTGRRSERFVQQYWKQDNLKSMTDEMIIQIGDYFADSIKLAKTKEINRITFAVFFGKAIKMAMGVACTHAAKISLSISMLSQWTESISNDSEFSKKIQQSNTARQAFYSIREQYPKVIDFVGQKVIEAAHTFAGPSLKIGCIIFDYEGSIVFQKV
jgi:cobalt-precorrin-5B (C1)-methyltransferase